MLHTTGEEQAVGHVQGLLQLMKPHDVLQVQKIEAILQAYLLEFPDSCQLKLANLNINMLKGNSQEAIMLWQQLLSSCKHTINRGEFQDVTFRLFCKLVDEDPDNQGILGIFHILIDEPWGERKDWSPGILNNICKLKPRNYDLMAKVIKWLGSRKSCLLAQFPESLILKILLLSLPIEVDTNMESELISIISQTSQIYILRYLLFGDTIFTDTIDLTRCEIIMQALRRSILLLKEKKLYGQIYSISLLIMNSRFEELDKLISKEVPSSDMPDYTSALGVLQSRDDMLSENNLQINICNKLLKIAICVSGQMRGYKDAFPTWKCFESSQHKVDYYIHTWQQLGHKYPLPRVAVRVFTPEICKAYVYVWKTVGRELLYEHYPNFMSFVTGSDRNVSQVCKNELQELYKTGAVVVEDASVEKFADFKVTSDYMYYKIQECYKLLEESRQDYDLIVRIRPDLCFKSSNNVDWAEVFAMCQGNNLLLGPVVEEAVINLPDMFAVGQPKAMSVYSHHYDIRKTIQQNDYYLPHYSLQCPHLSLYYSMHLHGITVRQFEPVEFGRMVDAPCIDPAVLMMILERDISKRTPTETDKLLLEACIKDIEDAKRQ